MKLLREFVDGCSRLRFFAGLKINIGPLVDEVLSSGFENPLTKPNRPALFRYRLCRSRNDGTISIEAAVEQNRMLNSVFLRADYCDSCHGLWFLVNGGYRMAIIRGCGFLVETAAKNLGMNEDFSSFAGLKKLVPIPISGL